MLYKEGDITPLVYASIGDDAGSSTGALHDTKENENIGAVEYFHRADVSHGVYGRHTVCESKWALFDGTPTPTPLVTPTPTPGGEGARRIFSITCYFPRR